MFCCFEREARNSQLRSSTRNRERWIKDDERAVQPESPMLFPAIWKDWTVWSEGGGSDHVAFRTHTKRRMMHHPHTVIPLRTKTWSVTRRYKMLANVVQPRGPILLSAERKVLSFEEWEGCNAARGWQGLNHHRAHHTGRQTGDFWKWQKGATHQREQGLAGCRARKFCLLFLASCCCRCLDRRGSEGWLQVQFAVYTWADTAHRALAFWSLLVDYPKQICSQASCSFATPSWFELREVLGGWGRAPSSAAKRTWAREWHSATEMLKKTVPLWGKNLEGGQIESRRTRESDGFSIMSHSLLKISCIRAL